MTAGAPNPTQDCFTRKCSVFCLTPGSTSRPRGIPGKNNLGVFVSASRLDEDSWSFSEEWFSTFAVKISPESQSPPIIFPRESFLIRPWPYHGGPTAGKTCGIYMCSVAYSHAIACCPIPSLASRQMWQHFHY